MAISEGIPQETIARNIRNPQTGNPISVETLVVAFKSELETGYFEAQMMVGASLLKMVKSGNNLGAVVWWDKTRGRRSEADQNINAKVDATNNQVVEHKVIVHGGLPQGSTPENPGGDEATARKAEQDVAQAKPDSA